MRGMKSTSPSLRHGIDRVKSMSSCFKARTYWHTNKNRVVDPDRQLWPVCKLFESSSR